MKYIIVDLEATCWDQKGLKRQNEIIEIGAVKVNEQGEIESEFNAFVKPHLFPELSDFCTELTSITQQDVDGAHSFPEVLKAFQDWINLDQPYWICSWGHYDKNQFIQDCKLHGLAEEWIDNHISIKHQYTKIKQLKRHIGMKWALQMEELELDGTHHRGIDDARNITKIFLKHINQWKFE